MWPAPVQEADRAGAARRAMWDIGQARRRTLSASSTGPLGCLSAGISSVGRLNRMPRYAFRRPTLYLPRRKSNAGRMECEKCGLARTRLHRAASEAAARLLTQKHLRVPASRVVAAGPRAVSRVDGLRPGGLLPLRALLFLRNRIGGHGEDRKSV